MELSWVFAVSSSVRVGVYRKHTKCRVVECVECLDCAYVCTYAWCAVGVKGIEAGCVV